MRKIDRTGQFKPGPQARSRKGARATLDADLMPVVKALGNGSTRLQSGITIIHSRVIEGSPITTSSPTWC